VRVAVRSATVDPMDPKPSAGMLLAPGAPSSAAAARLPGRDPFPPLDEHIVTPETTRDERIRGRRVVAMPALPPHADRQVELGYVIRGNVAPGYVGSSELLTRVGEGSDFATDVCVRKAGDDPRTGTRYLEELAFEVVNEQSARDIREKAEDMTARGVRRVIAIFVKTGKVAEWSWEKAAWKELGRGETIQDACLSRPVRVQALLDAAEANAAVARALVDNRDPVIEEVRAEERREGKAEGKAEAILAVLAARGLPVDEATRGRILGCRDGATLDRWIAKAAVAGSMEEVVGGEG
jgi:Putative restriction endonuclease